MLQRRLAAREALSLASLLRALAVPGRLRLLSFLAEQPDGEACVCHLTDAAGLSQPTVSHHLKRLTAVGLLTREKRGAWVYYWLVSERLEELHAAGSGVMAERLAAGNVALALLANTIATGTALVAILLALAPISGAHLNPAVTIVAAWGRALAWVDVPGYVGAQVLGAFAGVGLAHLMYGLPVFELSHHARDASGQLVSEFVATFGLVLVIWSCARFRTAAVPFAVGAYVTAAYWFTASTSFANPAVAAARLATNTFTGIRPHDVPGFVGAELLGAGSAAVTARWLVAAESPEVHP